MQMSGITVVYLGGFGRSGSTLIERTLGAAREWVNVGELVDLARSVAGARCGPRSASSPSVVGPSSCWTGWHTSTTPPHGSDTYRGCWLRHVRRPRR